MELCGGGGGDGGGGGGGVDGGGGGGALCCYGPGAAHGWVTSCLLGLQLPIS